MPCSNITICVFPQMPDPDGCRLSVSRGPSSGGPLVVHSIATGIYEYADQLYYEKAML